MQPCILRHSQLTVDFSLPLFPISGFSSIFLHRLSGACPRCLGSCSRWARVTKHTYHPVHWLGIDRTLVVLLLRKFLHHLVAAVNFFLFGAGCLYHIWNNHQPELTFDIFRTAFPARGPDDHSSHNGPWILASEFFEIEHELVHLDGSFCDWVRQVDLRARLSDVLDSFSYGPVRGRHRSSQSPFTESRISLDILKTSGNTEIREERVDGSSDSVGIIGACLILCGKVPPFWSFVDDPLLLNEPAFRAYYVSWVRERLTLRVIRHEAMAFISSFGAVCSG